MKKFLIFFALAGIFFIPMTPAFAKEIFVGVRYGLDFYFETNSVDYIQGNMFYVTVNEYLGDNSYDSNEWKFYNEHFDGSGACFFDYYYIGTRIPVNREQMASNILETCRLYETRISR